ncbi:hypothetical protein [Glaciihabitans sp. UYNi722]|uniref:hypothetical protein n=1 Tax=Glaciihabitans sp. UYNi722 TaxID=3156344 RepID=UPI0033907B60
MADAADIVTRFVANPDLSTVTVAELGTTISSLEEAASTADSKLIPYIEATEGPLRDFKAALEGKGAKTVQFTDFKAASFELLNDCKPYL